ncbi:hypothetical protein [Paramicrobacterium fandaimingii]|uniref:hypothetical protein n=1 Tax=Paramicrobacterium fandaimingii TaxID=2708079 RepID=UPI001424A0C1|nr:hypothetical protein [Microbacterium fandaimingii]
MQVRNRGVAASVALVGAMILGGASPALADTEPPEEPVTEAVTEQVSVDVSEETAPVTEQVAAPVEEGAPVSEGDDTEPVEPPEAPAPEAPSDDLAEKTNADAAEPSDPPAESDESTDTVSQGPSTPVAEQEPEQPEEPSPNSVPVTNGATAEVRDCYWDSFDLLTHPVCNIDVTPPDMEPRTYAVSLRDIEATPAFKALDVDPAAWYWAWEKDNGVVLHFEHTGDNIAGLSARIDMSPRPDAAQEWSCFGGAPAPVGEGYVDFPSDPAAYSASITVGETLHFDETEFIKATGWTEVYPTDVNQLGDFDYDNTTAEDTLMAAWTPVSPGTYEFQYMFGTENCASHWFTGTITVEAAPEKPVIEEPKPEQPPVVVEPEPVADVTPVQKSAPIVHELPRTGVEPGTAWLAVFAVLAMALGIGIAAGARRRKPEKFDKE